MKTHASVMLLMSTLLAACASTGGLQTQSRLIDPNALASRQSLSVTALSAAAWPTEAWWTSLADPQLNRLIERALRDQPDLHIAEARVRQAQAAANGVNSSLYPQLGASFSSTRQRFSEHSTVPPQIAGSWNSINQGTLGVSYELDFWGKNQAAVDAALDRSHAAEVGLQAARLMLTTAVARSYIRLDSAYAQRDLAEATLKQREHILDLTRQRVAAELDSQLELTQAEAALPAVRERIAAINQAIALLNNQLAALTGQGPDAGLSITRPKLAAVAAVSLPSAVPAQLLGRRPDVVAQRWRVEAAGKDVKFATTRFYPNITLNAFVGSQSLGLSDFLNPGSRILGFGPAVTLPIFNGGRLRSNLAINQAGYDAAVEQYNATVIAALHDVVDQLVSLQWLAQQVQQQNDALRLSQQAYGLALDRYRNGLANYLQVLSAEGQVLAQQQRAITSQTEQRELRLNLIRALGGGYVPLPAAGQPFES